MAVDDPNELDRVDQEIRINELKEAAKEAAGGDMTFAESDDLPPDIAEGFWSSVLAYEKAEWTTHFELLTKAGVELPLASEMDDATLTKKLWEVFHKLADLRVFFSRTDHLSDRELYTHMWEDSLREEVPDLPPSPNGAYCVDILGGCSEQDLYLQRKYYDDEEERQRWHKEWPDDEMPPHEDPPYDRDRHLPKAEF